MEQVERSGCGGIAGNAHRRRVDPALEVIDDLEEGDSSGSGQQDHSSPLVGRAVIGSPFGVFQGCEEFGDGP